jgi:hypothetical protein
VGERGESGLRGEGVVGVVGVVGMFSICRVWIWFSVVGCELALEGGNMEREGLDCPCPGRVSACETGTERRQRTGVWGRGVGTVPFFAPAVGAVFALDFEL